MAATALPRWDMTGVFPSLDSPEFRAEMDSVIREIQDLAALFEERGVRRRAEPRTDSAFVAAFEEVTGRMNALLDRVRTLSSYIGCFVTTDATDDLARARESELDNRTILLDQLHTRYVAWAGTSDVATLLQSSEMARDHEYMLHRAQKQAAHQMPEGEE